MSIRYRSERPNAVELPANDDITLAGSLHQPGKLCSVGTATGPGLDEHALAPGAAQRVELQRMILLVSTHAGVSQQHEVSRNS
jgi:hypothetical protein